MSAENKYPPFVQDPLERPMPTDPQTRKDVEEVIENGYIILENSFSLGDAAEAKAEIDRLSGDDPEAGRNPFEGLKTNRIYSLLNKTRVFDKFAIIPRVLALNDYFLEPGYLISAMHTIQINPGESLQDPHHDDAFCHIPRPRPPLGSAIIVAFDDFTAENGATNIIPGSHKWGGGRRGKHSEAIPAVMPAGSVVYFVATTWHGGGQNKTNAPRHSLTVQYCQPYIRQIENQFLAVDPRRLDEIPKKIVEMMGYGLHQPFIGYVDGLNPRFGAERMIQWLQRPVDRNPATFAHHASKI